MTWLFFPGVFPWFVRHLKVFWSHSRYCFGWCGPEHSAETRSKDVAYDTKMATKISSHSAKDGYYEHIWNLFFGFFGFPRRRTPCVWHKKPIGVVFGPNTLRWLFRWNLKTNRRFFEGWQRSRWLFWWRVWSVSRRTKGLQTRCLWGENEAWYIFSSSLEVVLIYHLSIAHLLYKILGANVWHASKIDPEQKIYSAAPGESSGFWWKFHESPKIRTIY